MIGSTRVQTNEEQSKDQVPLPQRGNHISRQDPPNNKQEENKQGKTRKKPCSAQS